MMFLPNFNSSSSTLDMPKEVGEAYIARLVHFDSGLCFIFYYRIIDQSDAPTVIPYVTAVQISPSGEITKLNSSFNLTSIPNLVYGLEIVAFLEKNDSFRLIGSDSGSLYEIWFFKNNNSFALKEGQITDYNEIRLVTPHALDDYFTMTNTSLEGTEETIIPISLKEFSAPDNYLFDFNSSSFFAFYYTGTYVIIRRLFLNGTYFHESIVDLRYTADYRHKLHPIIGKDGLPYLGVWWRNDDYVDDYTFTLLLVNLLSKSTFNHSFICPSRYLHHKVLIDTHGSTHLLLDYHAHPSISKYLKFSSNHTLDFQVNLTIPDSDRYSFPSSSFSLFQDNLLIGGVESDDSVGVVVINSSTGQIIAINSSIIPFIPYPDGSFITFDFFGIVPFLLLLFFFRKKKPSVVSQ